MEAWDEPQSESSVKAWIGVLIASLVLLGGYSVARDRLLGPSEPEVEIEEVAADSTSKKRSKKKRTKRKSRRNAAGEMEEYEEPTPAFVVDNREFRDIIAEGEAEAAAMENAPVIEEEPFIPPPEMYQPNGSYKPVASYAEPGAKSNVITLDLNSSGDSGPLDDAEVKKVLRVSALMPCYDEVVQKVPQMRGRVRMRFVVAADGHVMEATVLSSALRSRMVEQCIVDRARRWRFPASGGQKTRFTTHFDFSSR